MKISEQNKRRARLLHARTPVADLHSDLPGELLYLHRTGERNIFKEYYLPLWKQVGITLIGASVYVEEECLPEGGFDNVCLQIQALLEEIGGMEEEVCLIRTRDDLECAYRKEKIGILLYLEGMDFEPEESALKQLYVSGVRGASLTWSRSNMLASGCCRADEKREVHGRITEMGHEVLRRMQEMGMFLDISHLNDDGIKEVLAYGEDGLKILATHSNARSACPHYRNLTDVQLGKLGQRDGIVGLNACTLLSGSYETGLHLEMLQEQVSHLLSHAGEECVCLGLDLCSRYDRARALCLAESRPEGVQEEDLHEKDAYEEESHDALAGYGELYLLTAALLESGLSEKTVEGVLGKNAFAFLRRVFTK